DINLSLRDGYDLRRWILGAEGGRKSRLRGLKKRIEDLTADDEGRKILDEITQAAKCLPGERALERLRDQQPMGSFEQTLGLICKQVQARSDASNGGYSIETAVHPMVPELAAAMNELQIDLSRLQQPLKKLIAYLGRQLQAQATDLSTEQRTRLQ